MSVATLDAQQFPLHGTRLIEASAGTGKTYTIANLYLRILLGHGDAESRHQSPLQVDQILVVTFTEAATTELRDRIRRRIHQARLAFVAGISDDPFIQQLIDDMPTEMRCAEILLHAERQMDEAAIFTIHGFCQRMLKQHAFESGTLFTSELVTDLSALQLLCAADYWRRAFYPLSKPMVALIRQYWKTPQALLKAVRSWLHATDLQIDNTIPTSMAAFEQSYLVPALALKQQWQEQWDTIRNTLESCGMKKNAKTLNRLEDMAIFLASDQIIPRLGKDKKGGWALFGTATLEKSLLKSGIMPSSPLIDAVDQFLTLPHDFNDALKAVIQRDALQHIREQMMQMKQSRYQFSFDDLLSGLANALYDPKGALLAQTIRQQYSIALIDEFQDTDAQQYRIFQKLYMRDDSLNTEQQQSLSSLGLFMIGDPKQAIYAFRGADIFTYMQARQQVHSHYTLGTNWRSSSAMVNSVNTLFQQAQKPFIYDHHIPFMPVSAAPQADQRWLSLNDEPQAAMTLWLQHSETSVNSDSYLKTMSTATATEINRLLTASDQQACYLHNKDQQTPLQPGDIAVLVRSRHHAQLVRDALSAQNIASIYLSNQDSVFASAMAEDLQKVLHACLYPNNERALRAALATRLFQLDIQQLEALTLDEQQWEDVANEFSQYHQLWLNKGVLPMLHRLIFQRQLAEQTLAAEQGERQLTDLLHLGELLAEAALAHPSPSALLRWFNEQRIEPNNQADSQQLHLESERNLVQVVTIHKSKGLEYKVVFVPFICYVGKNSNAVYHDPNTLDSWLALINTDKTKQLAAQEQLAEDLRLIYVALTRAVYNCYLGFAPFKSGQVSKDGKTDLHLSAIGYLLNGKQPIYVQELAVLLERLTQQSPNATSGTEIVLQTPPEPLLPPYTAPNTGQQSLSARAFQGNIERNWWTTSYSALSRHHSSVDASLEVGSIDFSAQAAPTSASEEADGDNHNSYSLFYFPKGAQPGTFMHTLFEELDMVALRSDVSNDAINRAYLESFVLEQLAKAGFEEHWLTAICGMLQNCLCTPLDGKAMRLRDLTDDSRRVEMEFYLPIEHLSADSLNQLIAHFDPLSAQAGQLDFYTVKGMLKGFIDLTFVHEGRWYVLDYKSNWLGDNVAAYNRDAMAQVMIEHRYDLQYQLYSLALHRLLQQRLLDYDYEQHFGGVIYLFLRGVQPNDAEQHGIFSHKPAFEFIDALDQLFRGQPFIAPHTHSDFTQQALL